MAVIIGYVALALIALAALVPLVQRLREGRRAAPTSSITSFHVALGVATAVAAFGHSLLSVLALGSPQAIGAGDLALAAGGAAVLVLMAHMGIGLQLRDPKLRKRTQMRRRHIITASAIAVCALAHVGLLWSSAP